MGYNTLEIQCMEHLERRNKSPTDELLTKWGYQNHTVVELFVLLGRMGHHQAMTILKPYVDQKYHVIMNEGEESWTKLLAANPGFGLAQSSQVNCMAVGGKNVDDDHNLNVLVAETAKLKTGFSAKIQNIVGPHSVEENNGPQPEKGPQMPQTPGSGRSPPAFAPNALPVLGGLPPLSPVGVAALSAGAAGPSNQHQLDLRGAPLPQRKLSDASMVTLASECLNVLPMLDYKELGIATGNWKESNILGRGGFGIVFKGVWKETDVAIKRIEGPKGDSNLEIQSQQYLRELQVLQRFRHENILQLYGVSFNGNQPPCLVYQLMERGSLEDRLQCRNRTSPLTWSQRFEIAKGAARGLQFLHTVQDKPLIHGDIKSANILLNANYEPRIGDFGLARDGPVTHYTHINVTKVQGTKPYLPDEFLRNKKLSTKVDTYSFGVVLFELATGLRAFDDKRVNKYLKDEVVNHSCVLQLMDPKIGKDHITFYHLINLGKSCVQWLPKNRPEMVEVCRRLSALNQSQVSPKMLQEVYDWISSQASGSVSNQVPNGLASPRFPSPGSFVNAPPLQGSQGPLQFDYPNKANAQFVLVGQPSSGPASNNLPNHSYVVPKTTDASYPPAAVSPSVDPPIHPTILPQQPLNAPLPSPEFNILPPTESVSTRSSVSDISDSTSRESHSETCTAHDESLESPSVAEKCAANLPLLSVLGLGNDNSSQMSSDIEQPSDSFHIPPFVNTFQSSS